MTIFGHYIVMNQVKIADFKARLSGYLRMVRRGEEVVVTDRSTPVARVLPFLNEDDDFRCREPRRKSDGLKKLKFKPLGSPVDAMEALLEERSRG